MSTKYWNGPSGVYYEPTRDSIFTIEFTGARLYDYKRNKDMGGMFEFRELGRHSKSVAIIMSKHAVRIGDV